MRLVTILNSANAHDAPKMGHSHQSVVVSVFQCTACVHITK